MRYFFLLTCLLTSLFFGCMTKTLTPILSVPLAEDSKETESQQTDNGKTTGNTNKPSQQSIFG